MPLFRADEDGPSVADHVAQIVADGAREQVPGARGTEIDPFRVQLEPVLLGGRPAGNVLQLAEEDEVDLVVPALGYALINAGEPEGRDRIARFLQQLAPESIRKQLAGSLSAARQGLVFPEAGGAAVDQQLSVFDHDGLSGIAGGHFPLTFARMTSVRSL